jgi:Fe-S-cluster containining protein
MSEDALRWAEYHDHTIVEREGKLIVFVPNRCKQLADDNTCKIYDDRPDVCAKIPNRDCAIFQPEGCRYFE